MSTSSSHAAASTSPPLVPTASTDRPKKEKKKETVAFIVTRKNQQLVSAFLREQSDIITSLSLRLVLTTTVGEGVRYFESLENIFSITYVPSLQRQGDKDLARMVAQSKVSSVFFFDPPSVSKSLPAERLQALVEACWKGDVPFCVSRSMMDLVLQSMSGGTVTERKSATLSNAQLSLLLQRQPSFDLPIGAAELAYHEKVSKWSPQQYEFWLKANQLDAFIPLLQEQEGLGDAQYFSVGKDKRLSLVSAPLDAAVRFVLSPSESSLRDVWDHRTFTRTILLSHTLLTDSLSFLKLLRSEAKSIEGNVLESLLEDWLLLEGAYHFRDDQALVDEFNDCLRVDFSCQQAAAKLSDLLLNLTSLSPPYFVDFAHAPKPIFDPRKATGALHPLVLDPLELARQLTLRDEVKLQKLHLRGFLGAAWMKKDALSRVPELMKYIHHCNRSSEWITTQLMSYYSTEYQSQALTLFIEIGERLLALCNYQGVMNILSSLHSSAVSQLKLAWADVTKVSKKAFANLTDSLSLMGNYKNYRVAVSQLANTTACIPLIPVLCSDLNGLNEVFATTTEKGFPNWEKHSRITTRIWTIKPYLFNSYTLAPIPSVQTFLEESVTWEGERPITEIGKLRNKFGDSERSQEWDRLIMSEGVRPPNESDAPARSVQLEERDWQVLNTGASLLKLTPEHVVLKPDVPNRYLYKIKKGTLRVELPKTDERGMVVGDERIRVAAMSKGIMFGESCLLANALHSAPTAWVIADTYCEIYRYEAAFLTKLCRADHSLSAKLNKILTVTLANRLKNLGKFSVQTASSSSPSPSPPSSPSPSYTSSSSTSRLSVGDVANTSLSTERPKTQSQGLEIIRTDKEREKEREGSVGGRGGGGGKEKGRDRKSSLAPPPVHPLSASTPAGGGRRSKAEKSKKLSKKEEEDREYHRLFNVPKNEVVVRSARCAIKGILVAHGEMFISQSYLCFAATTFGRKSKEVITFSSIVSAEVVKKRSLAVEYKISDKETKTLIFRDFHRGHLTEVLSLIHSFIELADPLGDSEASLSSTSLLPEDAESEAETKLGLNPTDEDWLIVLQGTHSQRFEKNEFVIREGQQSVPRIYQISTGSCRIVKTLPDGSMKVLGSITESDSIFGELSFLDGPSGQATASVVAEGPTSIHIIEGFYLDVIFMYYPGLCGRFYHYLSQVLSSRLVLRQQKNYTVTGEGSTGPSRPPTVSRRLSRTLSQDSSEGEGDGEDEDDEEDEGDDNEVRALLKSLQKGSARRQTFQKRGSRIRLEPSSNNPLSHHHHHRRNRSHARQSSGSRKQQEREREKRERGMSSSTPMDFKLTTNISVVSSKEREKEREKEKETRESEKQKEKEKEKEKDKKETEKEKTKGEVKDGKEKDESPAKPKRGKRSSHSKK